MTAETLTKAFVEQLIRENSDRVAFEVNEKGTSELWKLFYLVSVDGARKEYACCSMCSCVVAHSHRTGTGSLLRHKCAQFIRESLLERPKSEMGAKANMVPKAVVEQLISENSGRVTFESNEKGTSHLWQIFKLVNVDAKREPYACCSMCGAVVVYSVKTGTGSLLRHKCSQYVVETSSKKRRGSKKFEASPSKNTMFEKRQELLAFNAIKYISKDLQPYGAIEDPGFREMAQALIDFGADFGKMPVEGVLSCVSENSLSQTHIPRMYLDIKQRIAVLFCATDFMAFTTDVWTDVHHKCYASLNVHLITEDFEYHCLSLGTRELTEGKTPMQIRKMIISIIAEYTGDTASAEEKMKCCAFVTTNDASVIAAFENPLMTDGKVEEKKGSACRHVSCGCDALNRTLNDVLEKQSGRISGLEQLLHACEEIVTYFKKNGLNNKLNKSLKYEGVCKWNTIYSLVEQIYDNYDVIHEILEERDELHKMDTIDADVLLEIKNFLELFKQCYESLSAENRPTIQEFSLWRLKLKKHCDVNKNESQMTNEIKTLTLQTLQMHFVADTLHHVALLLNPSFKSLRVLSSEDKIQATATVIELINAVENKNNVKSENDTHMPEGKGANNETPVKRIKRDETAGEFDEFMDICIENSTESSDELNRYLEKRVSALQPTPDKLFGDRSRLLDIQDDILDFWKKHRVEFPALSKIARHILAIPACSAPSRRLLARSGHILEERRPNISPDCVDEVLFLHHNL